MRSCAGRIALTLMDVADLFGIQCSHAIGTQRQGKGSKKAGGEACFAMPTSHAIQSALPPAFSARQQSFRGRACLTVDCGNKSRKWPTASRRSSLSTLCTLNKRCLTVYCYDIVVRLPTFSRKFMAASFLSAAAASRREYRCLIY